MYLWKYDKKGCFLEIMWLINLVPLVREMEMDMEKSEIVGYEPLVNDLKLLINKKQYHVLKMINAETINLYWEIGEEIYKQNLLYKYCKKNYRKNFREQKVIQPLICGECVIFT